MKGGNGNCFQIRCMILSMNRAGRGNKHAQAVWEEWGVVKSLIKIFQKLLCVCFQLVDARFEREKWIVFESMISLLKLHEGLPCDLDVKVVS